MNTMKNIASVVILFVMVRGVGDAAEYSVEPRSKGNTITLEATNKLGRPLVKLMPSLSHKPDWLIIRSISTDKPSLDPNATVLITVTFDISSSLESGKKDDVIVVLTSLGETVLQHSITLVGAVPKEYSLGNNYPNPFNPSTNIDFTLPLDSKMRLEVYDILGRTVATLLHEVRPAGYYTSRWDGTANSGARVGSGTYFVRMEAHSLDGKVTWAQVKKALLVK